MSPDLEGFFFDGMGLDFSFFHITVLQITSSILMTQNNNPHLHSFVGLEKLGWLVQKF
jgi:hypothetical protein